MRDGEGLQKSLARLLTAFVICASVCSLRLYAQTEEYPRLSSDDRMDLIHRAISYLADRQSLTGEWDGGSYPTVMTALSGLALVSAGNVSGRGPYGANVERAIYAILNSQNDQGVFGGDLEHSMYGHGYATLFLSQVYGMTRVDPKIREALVKAIRVIVRSQSSRGGWYYTPFSSEDEGSVTIVQMQSLRACHNAGIEVPYGTIQRGVDYIRNSQTQDGSIAYGVQRGNGSIPLTAQGMAVLYNAGMYDVNEIQAKGFEYLDRNFDQIFESGYYFYTQFYAAQTFKQRGGRFYEHYFYRIEEKLKNTMVKDASGDIHWEDSQVNAIFGTAMAVMILAMPLEYLPIFTN